MISSQVDIENVTNGLPKYIYKQLTQMISTENAIKIAEYIISQKTEVNLSDNYRRSGGYLFDYSFKVFYK